MEVSMAQTMRLNMMLNVAIFRGFGFESGAVLES
jgi:hypothetical protein